MTLLAEGLAAEAPDQWVGEGESAPTAPRRESVQTVLDAIDALCVDLPAAQRIRACQRVRSYCDSIETIAAAALVSDDGNTRAAKRALENTKTSRRETNRAAKRAAVAAKSAAVADKVRKGELSGEQVDAVARADERTEGAASNDAGLLDALGEATADETDSIVDKFIADQQNQESVRARHDRQRRQRDVRKFTSKTTGMSVLAIEGDDESIDEMHRQLLADANRLYQLDGGRDTPNSQHQRSHGNRIYDAAHARISGGDAAGESAESGESTPSAKSGRTTSGSKRHTPPAPRRPTMVVTVDLAKVSGHDASLMAEQIGLGPIPDSVLARYLGSPHGCDLVGLIFGVDGQPLWLGRSRRYASEAQFLALVLRDRHCVLCDAGPERCQVHHRIPWHAPAKGETNIEDLVLVCDDCHHRIHEKKQTLYRHQRTGRWKLRDATAAETPPPRPAGRRRRTRPASSRR